jgi:hypothetical protein
MNTEEMAAALERLADKDSRWFGDDDSEIVTLRSAATAMRQLERVRAMAAAFDACCCEHCTEGGEVGGCERFVALRAALGEVDRG